MKIEDDFSLFERNMDNNNIMNAYNKDAFLCPLYIKANYKLQFLKELQNLGVDEKRVFPGLDGVGKYIERNFRNEEV